MLTVKGNGKNQPQLNNVSNRKQYLTKEKVHQNIFKFLIFSSCFYKEW